MCIFLLTLLFIGGKIRGSVAQITFDEFHKHSAQIIQHAVFGTGADGKPGKQLKFESNNLVMLPLFVVSVIGLLL